MERAILIGLVFAIGLLQPVQAAMNARFRSEVVHPFQAGIVNMYVGAAAITLILLVGPAFHWTFSLFLFHLGVKARPA